MYKYIEIIDMSYQSHLITDIVVNKIGKLLDDHKLHNFNVKFDLLELDEIEVFNVIDLHSAPDYMYFYGGIQYTFEELKKIVIENLRKLVIVVEDKGE